MSSLSTSMHDLLFAQGSNLGAALVAIRTVIVFAFGIFYVRLGKKRFMAQATAMDLAMVVILGSTLSRAINGGGSLASTLIAGLILIILQRALAHFSARSRRFGRLVKGSAEIILRDGQMDSVTMMRHDITEHDLHQEMRIRALTDDVSKIRLAVLERSGQIGFVKATKSDG